MILDNAENFSQEKNQFLHELLKMFTEELSLIIVLKDTFKNCLDCEKCNKIAYKANNICCHDFCTNFVNNKITINSKKIQIINDEYIIDQPIDRVLLLERDGVFFILSF